MTTSFHRIDAQLFERLDSAIALERVRRSLGAVCFALLTFGPYDKFHQEAAGILLEGRASSLQIAFTQSQMLAHFVGIISSAAVTAGIFKQASTAILSICLLIVNYAHSILTPQYWSYNSHLNIFLGIMTARDLSTCLCARNKPAIDSFSLYTMQFYVPVMYFQTGLSKLVHGGLSWFTGGQTAMAALAELGTPFGHALATYPDLVRVGSVLTGIFELTFPILFFAGGGLRTAVLLMAIAFHLTIWATMSISFWHYWVLFPALFMPASRNKRIWPAKATTRLSSRETEASS